MIDPDYLWAACVAHVWISWYATGLMHKDIGLRPIWMIGGRGELFFHGVIIFLILSMMAQGILAFLYLPFLSMIIWWFVGFSAFLAYEVFINLARVVIGWPMLHFLRCGNLAFALYAIIAATLTYLMYNVLPLAVQPSVP